jgi:hypothetical protein
MGVKRGDHGVLVAALKRVHQSGRHLGVCGRRGRARAIALFLSNDGCDIDVAALGGDGERARRVAVRPDALARVGSVLHQQADDVRPSMEHRMVQGSVLVVFRHIEMDQLGTRREHRLHHIDVTGAYGVAEPADRHAIDERLQSGPAVEAVGPRDHELRVVQREARRLRSLVMGVHLRRGVGVAAGQRLEQLLRLPLELDQVGLVAERASGRVFP